MKFHGAFTAMITPFKGDDLDEEGLIANIHRQLEANISGLVMLGSTGEASTITHTEEKRVIETAVKEVNGKIPIIVGCGCYSTKETIARTREAKELGADCALVVTPYYNKPTQEGIFRHYEALTAAVDFPILLYNHPGRCGTNVEASTMERIAALPHVVGVKDCSGNFPLISDFVQIDPSFTVLSGDDILTLPLMSLGGKGVISIVSNLVPEQVVALVEAASEGDFDLARRLHFELLPLFKASVLESNPIPIKAAMELCGLPSGGLRLPLYELNPQNKKILENVLEKLNSAVVQ